VDYDSCILELEQQRDVGKCQNAEETTTEPKSLFYTLSNYAGDCPTFLNNNTQGDQYLGDPPVAGHHPLQCHCVMLCDVLTNSNFCMVM